MLKNHLRLCIVLLLSTFYVAYIAHRIMNFMNYLKVTFL